MPKIYKKPEYSKTAVNKAGQVFISQNFTDAEFEESLKIIDNWRLSHYFPLNTFQWRLRSAAKKINPRSNVVQRIKRLSSINMKLKLEPALKLSQMQDIGGCRAIMKDIFELDLLVDHYLNKSKGIKHKLHHMDDYITNPKPSGYRGIHLIYKYRSDKSTNYHDMRIEIQIRTLMQHAWATTVETVGTFKNMSLKSGIGDAEWLRFFSLMGTAMAITESKPIVPGTSQENLRHEIVNLSKKLQVENTLESYRTSLNVIGNDENISNKQIYLLVLDPIAKSILIKGYMRKQLLDATSEMLEIEKSNSFNNKDAVLVSADSIENLKLAYPNYYLDTELFLGQLKEYTRTGQLRMF